MAVVVVSSDCLSIDGVNHPDDFTNFLPREIETKSFEIGLLDISFENTATNIQPFTVKVLEKGHIYEFIFPRGNYVDKEQIIKIINNKIAERFKEIAPKLYLDNYLDRTFQRVFFSSKLIQPDAYISHILNYAGIGDSMISLTVPYVWSMTCPDGRRVEKRIGPENFNSMKLFIMVLNNLIENMVTEFNKAKHPNSTLEEEVEEEGYEVLNITEITKTELTKTDIKIEKDTLVKIPSLIYDAYTHRSFILPGRTATGLIVNLDFDPFLVNKLRLNFDPISRKQSFIPRVHRVKVVCSVADDTYLDFLTEIHLPFNSFNKRIFKSFEKPTFRSINQDSIKSIRTTLINSDTNKPLHIPRGTTLATYMIREKDE